MRNRIAVLVLLGVLILAGTSGVFADTKTLEDEVKAAFLYNFTKFIVWPEESFSSEETPLEIAVYRDTEFAELLGRIIEGKAVHGRPLTVVLVDSLDADTFHHVLFLRADQSGSWSRWLEECERGPMLLVGETEGFAEEQGTIAFKKEDNKLRFAVHLDRARRSDLEISSKLLGLAEVITD